AIATGGGFLCPTAIGPESAVASFPSDSAPAVNEISDLSNVPPEYHDLRSGSKNLKPDALSRLYSPDTTEKEAEPIVPSHWTCGAVV
ncbi:hypothetical protein ILYODFUR_005961, partial [Ilyodon furcidens]